MEIDWKKRAEIAEADLALAKRLLSMADEALGAHWFEGSYNNEEVIEASRAINAFLSK